MLCVSGIVALLLGLATAVPAPQKEAPIYWGGRRLKLAELPPELSPAARLALEAWHPWGSHHAYRLDLDSSGRLLLLSRGSNDNAPRQLELALAVIDRFERELPAPAVRLVAAELELGPKVEEPTPPAAGDRPLPEDPEDPEGGHPWALAPPKPAPITRAAPVITTWGSQGQPLDTQTMVLFLARDQDDFESLLDELGERFPFLTVWSTEAKALQGFVLGDPLAAAYLENPAGVEEWNPDNELVSRIARLALLRRFGDLPNWIVQGYAWHMEIAQTGAVYCFPWRDEFVSASEHASWPQIVRRRYEKTTLAATDFMGWRRGRYVDAEAKASWGVCEYLLSKEAARLPGLLDELRLFRVEHGRIQVDPSTWRRDLEYEIPVSDQKELFSRRLGPDFLKRATAFFRRELAP